MKWMLFALAVVGLAGCATYSELQQKAPLFQGHSGKTPAQFAECVLPKWVDLNASSHIVSDGDSRTIVMPGQGPFANNTVASLTAVPAGGGSDISYRTPVGSSFPGPKKQWAAAQACM
jgi:hypothetical protein